MLDCWSLSNRTSDELKVSKTLAMGSLLVTYAARFFSLDGAFNSILKQLLIMLSWANVFLVGLFHQCVKNN